MSGMFDDMMMGARAAKATFKGIKKAVELTNKAVKSEKFQKAASELKDKAMDAAGQIQNSIKK